LNSTLQRSGLPACRTADRGRRAVRAAAATGAKSARFARFSVGILLAL